MTIDVGKVAMVDISRIKIGDRQREIMGDLDGLESSMKESGLISPLAVKEIDGENYLLLAGERRLQTLKKNKVEIIPVRIYDKDISEIEIKVIEKSENFHRKDMEFWENDRLTLEIHTLQQQIYGVKAPGPDQQGWTLGDTGSLIGKTNASVSTAIKRAEAREAFPELFVGCKTQKDASKLMQKMDEAIVKETIAKRLESDKSNSSLHQLSKCFILGDFFEGVKQIPDGIMHIVEIDPPYAIDLNKAKKSEGESNYVQDQYNEIDKSDYVEFLAKTFKECYRVMTDHSWLLCWFAPEPWFETIFQSITDAGFNSTRMAGIWTKPSGQSKRPEMHLANTYEMFFYAWKGRPAMNKAGRSNNFNFSPVPHQQKIHPTERPIELTKEMYETFAFPGSRILIPFLGSGNGLIAANELGMSPVGFELGKGYKDSFLVRLHTKGI